MTTLLVDGDLFAYRQAAASETGLDFGGHFILSADAELGAENLSETINSFQETLGADRVIVTISDVKNFRHDVLPSYKSNRDGVRRPMILSELKRHLIENFETFIRPGLEADDVMGILATNPVLIKGEKIIVTMDKDLRTVPGLHWNPTVEGETKHKKPTEVSVKDADRKFYTQVLSGDAVDGYSGCIGIGPKRAEQIVDAPFILREVGEEIKRGPNKGTMRYRWMSEPTTDIWASIVSHYEKSGQSEEVALQMARVARILRHEDYDYKRKEPILWQPNKC